VSIPKLNSMRILEQAKVPYEVLTYPDTLRDASEVAEAIGLPYWMVYKTLVTQAEGSPKPFLVMLPSDQQLDLKKLARSANVKKVRMVKHKEAEELTGLKVGGISGLMLRDKNWTLFLDKAATELEHIVLSAGQRGLQLRVPVVPLLNLLRARLAEVCADEGEGEDDEADT
jgi:Cys-tRNA(Pro)/Cys-tRNA(Cys) deacylase